jgi:hypothetical protein
VRRSPFKLLKLVTVGRIDIFYSQANIAVANTGRVVQEI